MVDIVRLTLEVDSLCVVAVLNLATRDRRFWIYPTEYTTDQHAGICARECGEERTLVVVDNAIVVGVIYIVVLLVSDATAYIYI